MRIAFYKLVSKIVSILCFSSISIHLLNIQSKLWKVKVALDKINMASLLKFGFIIKRSVHTAKPLYIRSSAQRWACMLSVF